MSRELGGRDEGGSPHPPPPVGRWGWSLTETYRAIGFMYLALMVGHAAVLAPSSARIMSTLAGVSAVGLLVASRSLRRRPTPPTQVTQDRFVFGIASVILANTLTHLAVEGRAHDSIYLYLLIVGSAAFIRSGLWFGSLVGLSLLGWIAIVLRFVPDFDVIHYGFATLLTLALSLFVFNSRRSFLDDVEVSHSTERGQSERLQQTLGNIHQELYARKQELRKLEAADARNAAVIEVASSAVVLVDTNGLVIEINNAAAEMFGLTRDSLVGKFLTETIIPESLRKSHTIGFQHYLESGLSTMIGKTVDFTAKHAEGHEFPVEITIQELRSADEPLVFVAFITDLTERRRVEDALLDAKERAEEGSRAKSQFLARMSHEIRTPLNAILGLNELAIADLAPSRGRELLERSRGAGEYLSAVLGDLLDLAKIEANRLEVEFRPLSPRHLLEEASDFLAARAAERGLDLILEVDPNVPTRLVGDSTRIRQIVTNLVGNAIKFTPRGWIRVVMRTQENYLHIDVEDTGIGVSPELTHEIFEEFEQSDKNRESAFGGTGLGLTISRRLASLMNGELTLTDREGGGSRFSLILPYEATEQKRAQVDLHESRIVVALPSEVERQAVVTNLQHWGPKIEAVSSMAELRELLLSMADDGAARGTTILFDVEAFPLSSCPAPDFNWVGVARSPASLAPDFATGLMTRPLGPRSLARILSLHGGLRDPSPSAVEDTVLAPARILVVEDNEINQVVLSEMLRAKDMSVEIASSGFEAIDLLEGGDIDVILLDIEMPGLSGFETLQRIRQSAMHAETPTIAVTAYATHEMRQRVIDSGFDGFISKPIDSERIVRILAEHIPASKPAHPVGEDGIVAPVLPPVIDIEVLERNTEGNQSIMRKLAEIFERTGPESVEAIRRAAQQGSKKETRRALHKIRGTLADIGAHRSLGIAESMNEAARHGELEEVLAQVDDLDRAVADACVEFALVAHRDA